MQSPGAPAPHAAPPSEAPASDTWLAFDRTRRITLTLVIIAAAALLMPNVIWAPMFGDPGEVQLTAAVGGLGHPPGQAGIINIMRLLCLVVPAEPYLTACAANALFALAVLAVFTLLQLRTGVHPLAAAVSSFIFLTDDQFWHAAITTETYATCFLLLAGSVWSFLSWLHHPRPWKLWLAAALFTYLAVNRAPTATFGFAFLIAVLAHPKARRYWATRTAPKLALLAALTLVSLATAVVTLWVRDTPDAPYSYLQQAGPSQPFYPQENLSAPDKARRLWWLITARQYDYMFHPSIRTVKGQARWLITEFGSQHCPLLAIMTLVIILGVRAALQTNRVVALFLLAMLPAGILPILLIRVVSHTTLLPNLLFPLLWLFGLGLTRLMTWHRSAVWQGFILTNVGFAIWWTIPSGFLQSEPELDAREHIAAIDLQALPPSAVLIDFDVVPLVYHQRVNGIRPDITILVPHGRLNRTYIESLQRPVFTTQTTLPRDLDADLIGQGPVREIKLRPIGPSPPRADTPQHSARPERSRSEPRL